MGIEVSDEHADLIESVTEELLGISYTMKTLIRERGADPVILSMRGLAARLEALASIIDCSMDKEPVSVADLTRVLNGDALGPRRVDDLSDESE